MENNEIIKYEGGLIKQANNAIAITNKLLAVTEPQLIPYRKKDKWGFCTPDKRIVIDCVYDGAIPFSEGLASVKLNDKWGFINKNGTQIVPCIYGFAYSFSEGLASVDLNGKWRFIDKTGKEIIPCIHNFVLPFSEGLAAVQLNDKWGFIDKTGNEIIPCKYYKVSKFSEGLAGVCYENHGFEGLWGFINKTGQEVIPCKYYKVGNFSEGLANIQNLKKEKGKWGLWGFIDKTGKEIIPCKYYEASGLSEGLALIKSDYRKRIYINKLGKKQIRSSYGVLCSSELIISDQSSFHEGLAGANGKGEHDEWGFIDKSGEVKIPFIYRDIAPFKNGLAWVGLYRGFWEHTLDFYIDKNGVEYWED